MRTHYIDLENAIASWFVVFNERICELLLSVRDDLAALICVFTVLQA
jgi:hypothetical protein